MKIIKGKSFMIKLGIKSEVKIKGKKIEAFKFLKNSISSNKFNISPKQKKIKITFMIVLKKPESK